jgi:hypothetical protein
MARMFSLQTIFGKGDKFYGLLEQSAATVCESARALHELLSKPGEGSVMAAFTATRAREKELAAQISEGLVNTFVTALDRTRSPRRSRSLPNATRSWPVASAGWILPSVRWCWSAPARWSPR